MQKILNQKFKYIIEIGLLNLILIKRFVIGSKLVHISVRCTKNSLNII